MDDTTLPPSVPTYAGSICSTNVLINSMMCAEWSQWVLLPGAQRDTPWDPCLTVSSRLSTAITLLSIRFSVAGDGLCVAWRKAWMASTPFEMSLIFFSLEDL